MQISDNHTLIRFQTALGHVPTKKGHCDVDFQKYYLKCARILWKYPQLMSHRYSDSNRQENENLIKSLISKCVDGRDFCHEDDDAVNQTIDEIINSNI